MIKIERLKLEHGSNFQRTVHKYLLHSGHQAVKLKCKNKPRC